MSRSFIVIALGMLAGAALLLLMPAAGAVSREEADVFVTNWPVTQEIEGIVSIRGPIENATITRREGIIVSPVKRADTTRLVEGGTLVTEGYPYLVLSLVGQVKGSTTKPGDVGVILLPEEQTIRDAFNERGQFMFPLEVEAKNVAPGSPYFFSDQTRFVVGFPRYKVLLYNTSDKTVEVDLFAYLTN